MSQRLQTSTKWVWCVLAACAGPLWSPVRSVSVRAPPSAPSTIEAQAKFFQYRHLPNAEDYDQGHRLGSERHFTERHERSRPSEGLFSAKVRWGDKQGGYGEHYWDLNHAGHADNHGDDGYNSDNDDGSYHPQGDEGAYHSRYEDPYDEHSDHKPAYEDEYDKENSYEESNRAKRAHNKTKAEPSEEGNHEEAQKVAPQKNEDNPNPRPKSKYSRKPKEPQPVATKVVEQAEKQEPEETTPLPQPQPTRRPLKHRRQHRPAIKEQIYEEDHQRDQRPAADAQGQSTQFVARRQPEHYISYEGGAGVREHQQPEASASKTRLFLEQSTGHVVDRATGQAYVLQPIQPIVVANNYQ